MIRMSKFGAGIGAPSREDRLMEAADINLKLGNVQRYCELLIELGQVKSSFPNFILCKKNLILHFRSIIVEFFRLIIYLI